MFPKHVAIDPRFFCDDRPMTAEERRGLADLLEHVETFGAIVDDRKETFRAALKGVKSHDLRDPYRSLLHAELLKLVTQPQHLVVYPDSDGSGSIPAFMERMARETEVDSFYIASSPPEINGAARLDRPYHKPRFPSRPDPVMVVLPDADRGPDAADHPQVSEFLRRGLAGSRRLRLLDPFLLSRKDSRQFVRFRTAVERLIRLWLSEPCVAEARLIEIHTSKPYEQDGDERAAGIANELDAILDSLGAHDVERFVAVQEKWAASHDRYVASDWAAYLLPAGIDRVAPDGSGLQEVSIIYSRNWYKTVDMYASRKPVATLRRLRRATSA